MEAGQLTKVFHDFFTTIDGELSLAKGEYFLIHDVIDKHWCYGESRDRRGKFPSNHLHKVDIPDLAETEKLFVSVAAFRGEQPGDLAFDEGQLVIGIEQVEANWYLGYLNPRKGIFPLSHVWLLNPAILKKPADKKSVSKRGRVKTSLKAQLDEELDLREGEIVTVLEILDDGWVRGKSEDGRTGTFPEAFVDYLEGEEDRDETGEATGTDQTDKSCPMDRKMNSSEALPTSVLAGAPIFKDFGQTHIGDNRDYDDPAPSYYDLFPATGPDDNLNPLGVEPYAITLFPFNAQFPNELSFAAGEVVHLVKHVGAEWLEGKMDDARGFFPVSYVNIIVDCSIEKEVEEEKARVEDDEAAEPTIPEMADTRPSKDLEPGTPLKVEYTFEAQMNGDLSVTEGEIVTVLEIANDDWISVRNKNGATGLCPRGYLNAENVVTTETEDSLEDFVVMRKDETTRRQEVDEERRKRLSEPHRPAPPAPAPGRMPLEKHTAVAADDNISPTLSDKQKRADKRQNVISELVITEKEYVRDLKVTYETFNLHNPSFLEARGIDVTILFGNIVEVIGVAEELLDLVLGAMKGCDEEYQTIAPCFMKMADKLQAAYGKYCANHEAALALLKKYEDNREIINIFDKGIETLRRQVVCFDMSSILIKPVQRILKYPLMLYELIKCTEENHPDRKGIEEAWKAMTEVASHINEYKRRKDLVSKYLDGETTLMRKMAKLTMHSVAKKSSRLSAKLSATLGLTNLSADPVFEELERQFKSLEKSTWQLSKDVELCVNFLNDEANCGEVLADLLAQYHSGTADNEIRRFRDTREIIRSDFLKNLCTLVDRRVNVPVNSLITLLEGPAVLITKRYDKLLDYDNAISKSDRIAPEELASAKNNFEALNQQLLEELPVLIDAASSILVNSIGAFADARKLLNGKILKRYLKLSESATQVAPQDIFESFLVNHNLVWNQITRNTFAGAASRTEDFEVVTTGGQDAARPIVDLCPQSEKQRLVLTKRYTQERLYRARENIASTSSLDLSVAEGTLVAVIKKQDPMGDSSRWFVDNGVAQGFLPSRSLQPVPKSSLNIDRNSPDTPLETENIVVGDLMALDSPEKKPVAQSCPANSNWYSNDEIGDDRVYGNDIDAFGQAKRYQNIKPEFFYASYDFHGNMEGTLAVTKGQALKLVTRCDKKGNDEWWLMQDRVGNTGYVPHNYLSPPPK